MEIRVGVYVCHCGTNIAGVVDVEEVARYAATLPNVVVARNIMYTCSDQGQGMIREDIEKYNLNRVVIAACSPKMHESTFRKTLESAGLNPYLLEVANIREQVSWVHFREKEKATEKAKALVRAAVAKARLLEPLERKSVPVERSVLVIGGGIAGIQAALDLADAGLKVYLVEKSPSLGGHMAQLNKTFPTIDCAACILTPRMVDVAKHPNITLLAYSEVVRVEGYVGNFDVTVLKKARYVNEKLCAGCGACADACPRKVPNEFDAGLSKRKAIYVPFPQAVPLKYTVDPVNCLYMKYGRCKLCVEACPRGAIDFNQKDEEVKIRVGAIIVAVGFKTFDARRVPQLGYGRYKNVITGLELERLSSASGPTGGAILTASGKKPESVAFIQCVGSRDLKYNSWCCKIGCMATLKQAFLIKEESPETEVYVCYIDMRTAGKGYEEFYRRLRDMGVRFIHGVPSEIFEDTDGKLRFKVFDQTAGRLLELKVDMVVLQTGLEPTEDFEKLRRMLNVSLSPEGFFMEAHPKLQPVEANTRGIFFAGCCHSPKDIAETVAQASAAAAKALALLSKGVVEVEPLVASVNPETCSGCEVCVGVCPYRAIRLAEHEGRKRARVVDALCQGCGACVAACPSNAIELKGFTEKQILAQIEALTAEVGA